MNERKKEKKWMDELAVNFASNVSIFLWIKAFKNLFLNC